MWLTFAHARRKTTDCPRFSTACTKTETYSISAVVAWFVCPCCGLAPETSTCLMANHFPSRNPHCRWACFGVFCRFHVANSSPIVVQSHKQRCRYQRNTGPDQSGKFGSFWKRFENLDFSRSTWGAQNKHQNKLQRHCLFLSLGIHFFCMVGRASMLASFLPSAVLY